MPCKLPTHRSGSMGMDSKRATGWESCSLQVLLAQLGCQALRWEAERLGKQAVPVPQRHAGAQGSSEEGSWAVGWASPLPLLLEISPARSSALGLFVLGFFFLNPKISGFEAFVSFCLQFCDKISFHKKEGNASSTETFQRIWHLSRFARFALDFGVSTGAGLLKGEGILYFSQS